MYGIYEAQGHSFCQDILVLILPRLSSIMYGIYPVSTDNDFATKENTHLLKVAFA